MKWRADKKGCGAITSGGNTIAKGIYSFTASQKNDLIRIGGQCPMIGGNAVFRARALLALINSSLNYDDFDLCANTGINLKQNISYSKNIKARIYPNPANEKATLDYEIPNDSKGEFNLFSITGQNLISINLTGGQSTYTFSTTDLLPGIYLYQLKNNGYAVAVGKLVIIK